MTLAADIPSLDDLPQHVLLQAMGVPEIWRFDGRRLACLHLGPPAAGGKGKPRACREADKSLAFPFLSPADLMKFLKKLPNAELTSLMRSLRDWVVREFR